MFLGRFAAPDLDDQSLFWPIVWYRKECAIHLAEAENCDQWWHEQKTCVRGLQTKGRKDAPPCIGWLGLRRVVRKKKNRAHLQISSSHHAHFLGKMYNPVTFEPWQAWQSIAYETYWNCARLFALYGMFAPKHRVSGSNWGFNLI